MGAEACQTYLADACNKQPVCPRSYWLMRAGKQAQATSGTPTHLDQRRHEGDLLADRQPPVCCCIALDCPAIGCAAAQLCISWGCCCIGRSVGWRGSARLHAAGLRLPISLLRIVRALKQQRPVAALCLLCLICSVLLIFSITGKLDLNRVHLICRPLVLLPQPLQLRTHLRQQAAVAQRWHLHGSRTAKC